MSILENFFGDSKTAVEECSICGSTENLTVTVEDANGPTHWNCEDCKAEQNKETVVKTIDNSNEGNFATVIVTIAGEEIDTFWTDEFEQESKKLNELLDRLGEQEERFKRFHPVVVTVIGEAKQVEVSRETAKVKTYEQMNELEKKLLNEAWEMHQTGELMEKYFNIENATVTEFNPELTRWQNACDNMKINHNAEWVKYCKTQQGEKPDLIQQAKTLVDAPFAQQLDFICQAPEEDWQELLEIVSPGACPKYWAKKRANYDPDWQAKAAKKAKKREQARQRYAKNGRSVYPSKKDRLNGTTEMLPLAPA